MTTALYRRYRPETFAEVIGQDHVTAPLRQALRSGLVNHAYLFSGPRGCGKTSSARILARVLNCAQNTAEHPTDTPCGVCPSCVELATGGPGSLDVVEIDAASHGGVDDARELRERATFAPARDRFKVFILDEAHMVTPQGFNALLKIVEEPPPHVKFVFATTEPDKVIGTIRSRTHHYPFRLVPPDVLVPYLEHVCQQEGVPVGPGVLSLVVRAGAGSVRDSLSVLDQLIAGAGPSGLTYEPAVALLGYTPATLLDDLVEALAARDGGAAFRVVERVIATGHEPRRFVEDLLERLRDLIVIAAAGDRATAVLRDVPADQLARMLAQATHLGAFELSRSADLADAALTEMVGATSPRLQLELLMARLLLPSVDDSRTGLGARLDRLERVASSGAVGARPEPEGAGPGEASPELGTPIGIRPSVSPAAPGLGTSAGVRPAASTVEPEPPSATRAPEPSGEPSRVRPSAPSSPTRADGGTGSGPGPSGEGRDASTSEHVARADGREPRAATGSLPTAVSRPASPSGATVPVPAATPGPGAASAPAASSPADATEGGTAASTRTALDTEMLRRRWPEVLEVVRGLRKFTHALVHENALPLTLDATTLRLGFAHPGHVTAFRGGQHAEVLVRALHESLGVEVTKVEAVLNEADEPTLGASAPDAPPASGMPTRAQAEASWDVPSSNRPPAGRPEPQATARPAADARPAPDRARSEQTAEPAPAPRDEDVPPGPADVPPPWDDEPPPDDPGPMPDPELSTGRARPGVRPGPAAGTGRAPTARPSAPAPASSAGSAAQARPGSDARPAPDWARSERPTAMPEEDEPSPDDPDLAGSGLVGAPLIAQILGGQVIDEQIDGLT